MAHYPEPARAQSKVDLEKRAHERATRAKELRAKGMSLRVIAAELGVSKSMVRNYVDGAPIPPDTKLIERPRKFHSTQHMVFHMSLPFLAVEAVSASAIASGKTFVEQCRHFIELGLAGAKS